MAIRVALIEDEPTFNRRFTDLIVADETLTLTGSCMTLEDGLALVEERSADVYLIDLGLPDGSGIELVRRIREHQPQADAMVVTIFGDDAHIIRSIEAGATGYVLKDSLPEDVVELIHEIRAGGSPVSPSIARRLLTLFREPTRTMRPEVVDNPLSGRETEILTLVSKGLTFAEIGDTLGISPNTVTTHVRKIYDKLSVNSRSEAVFEAQQLGVLR